MFFQNLSKLLNETDITLSIRGGAEQLTVSVVPKSTNPKSQTTLPIMTLSGSPVEMDREFFSMVTPPVSKATAFIVSVNKVQLEADLKKKEEEAKKKATKATPVVRSANGQVDHREPDLDEKEEEEEEEEVEVTPEPVKEEVKEATLSLF